MSLVASDIAAGEQFICSRFAGRPPPKGRNREKQKCELRARRNLELAQLQALRKSSTIVDGPQSPSVEGYPGVAWFLDLGAIYKQQIFVCRFPMNRAFETTLKVQLEWLPRRFRLLDARFCSVLLLRNFR
jgi:hypothetical protein